MGDKRMYDNLKIVHYPDPRLKLVSKPVQAFDSSLRELGLRMLQIMRMHKGVGLAAPQVGLNTRVFVMNHDGLPENDRVYINPKIEILQGDAEGEEGCLSIPDVNADILRGVTARLTAQDADGNPVTAEETGFIPRIWQHEIDHLDGILILDRMRPTDKMKARKQLRELESDFDNSRASG